MAESKSKRVRLIDVAERANVSRVVAGHVLMGSGGKSTRVSSSTAERVRAAAKELDYRPNLIARQLRGARTRTLAVLIDATGRTIHYERMRAIDRTAHSRGYRLMVCYLHQGVARIAHEINTQLDELIGRGVEGVILIRGMADWPDSIARRLEQLNLVVCNRQSPSEKACRVTVDLAFGIEQLVKHLVDSGRRKPVLMLPKFSVSKSNPRAGSFAAACKRFQLGHEATIWHPDAKTDTAEPSEVRRYVQDMLDKNFVPGTCDVILACNDAWAVQTMKVLAQRGIRVPEDVAVTGIDNIDIAEASSPELTTIDQCNDEYAAAVMDLMTKLIEGKTISANDRHVQIKPKLVIRESA